MRPAEAAATNKRTRKPITPLERASVAHLQNANEILGDDGHLEFFSYGVGTSTSSFTSPTYSARAGHGPCTVEFCRSGQIPNYYVTTISEDEAWCDDCRLWINHRHGQAWRTFEESHRFEPSNRRHRVFAWYASSCSFRSKPPQWVIDEIYEYELELADAEPVPTNDENDPPREKHAFTEFTDALFDRDAAIEDGEGRVDGEPIDGPDPKLIMELKASYERVCAKYGATKRMTFDLR